MRKFSLGCPAPSKAKPQFAVVKNGVTTKAVSGQQKTSIMCHFPTIKGNKRMEALRHYFHANMATLLETDPNVLYWTTDAQVLEFEHEGKPIKFKPDFHVEERGGPRAIRLMHSERLARQVQTERHGLLRDRYAAQGIRFSVLTDEDVAGDPRLEAAKDILYYRCWPTDARLVLDLASFAASDRPESLGEIHDWMGGTQEDWAQLIALVAKGFVELDLETFPMLSSETPVVSCKLGGLH